MSLARGDGRTGSKITIEDNPGHSLTFPMRSLKRMALASLLIVSVAAAAALGWFVAAYPRIPEPPRLSDTRSPQKVARGEYLFNNVARCVDCHSTRDWNKYAAPVVPGTEGKGGEAFTHDLMGVPGDFYARNITPTALANWTDEEIARAITTGREQARRGAVPGDAVSQLRRAGSRKTCSARRLHPHAQAAARRRAASDRSTFRCRSSCGRCRSRRDSRRTPRPVRQGGLRRLPGADGRMRGMPCHARHVKGVVQPGWSLPAAWSSTSRRAASVRAPNITPDADTGIGTWCEQQFVSRFKVWERAPERVLPAEHARDNTVMPWKQLGGMTRDDLAAIYAYLRAQPPVIHRVVKRDRQAARCASREGRASRGKAARLRLAGVGSLARRRPAAGATGAIPRAIRCSSWISV